MNHAFLIMAHDDWTVLKILVESLDDDRNVIYLHFDKKVGELPEIVTHKAKLVILETRVDVRWGSESQIEAEYVLFSRAVKDGPYQYYHLLSGADLPIKSQDYIHDFFDRHDGYEFIAFSEKAMTPALVRKVQRWHLFPGHFRDRSVPIRAARAALLKMQEILHIRRNRSVDFRKGANWVSITDGMARLFVDNIEWARKTFTHTFCCDEFVMQTLCWNSDFRRKIYDYDNPQNSCQREIGWKNNVLSCWTLEDLERLKNSPCLFSRKFDGSDAELLRQVRLLSTDKVL